MITLTIGGIQHTDALEEGSLCIRHYGALRSSFRAVLHFHSIPENFPKVGQEIQISEGETILWGGILVEAEQVCHSTESFTMTLRGQGYEQILQRYCLPGIRLTEMSPSDATRHIFYNYLDPQEKLSLGGVAEGLTQKYAYQFYPAKASSVFDRLAKENGFVWWVDKEKEFYMQPLLPRIAENLCIDLTGEQENRLQDIQTLIYRSSTAECKNTQYVYNKELNVEGQYTNPRLLEKMKERYGSGQYGASATNSVVTNQDEAQRVAQQMLLGNPGMGELEFTTDSDVFVPGQIINVIAPVCGMKEIVQFCITEIRSVYFYNRFRYTVTARETDSGPLSTTAWEGILASGRTN